MFAEEALGNKVCRDDGAQVVDGLSDANVPEMGHVKCSGVRTRFFFLDPGIHALAGSHPP